MFLAMFKWAPDPEIIRTTLLMTTVFTYKRATVCVSFCCGRTKIDRFSLRVLFISPPPSSLPLSK